VFRIQWRIRLRLRAAALGASRFAFGGWHLWGRYRCAFTDNLLNLHREGLPFAATDQRERKERHARHRFPKDARKEAIHAVRLRPRFRRHTCIADQQIAIPRCEQMRPHEDPEQRRPRQRGMKEALDGALAAPGSRPTGKPQQRDPPGYREHRQHNPAQVPNGRCLDFTRQRLEQW